MKPKRLALTALTAALFALAVPATAHAGTTPPADPSGGGTGGGTTTSCRWISAEELRQRYTPEAIALLQAAGSLKDGQLLSCNGGGTGNGWGPLPPRDDRTV
ncbi:hypothetical protein GCM10010302_51680 [Streptomyces polychromogenes]|uniref:Secreted protein n=1 Tax=Streptomyces polychromogenes TaxID=67342 RepID=A0ABN0VJI2_9ACTN